MKFLSITGWMQPPIQFDTVVTNLDVETNIIKPVDYNFHILKQNKFNGFLDKHYDCVVAWSVGALLFCYLYQMKLVMTDKIIFIAPVFQFVDDSSDMTQKQYQKYLKSFSDNPQQFISRFIALVAKGDKYYKEIYHTISQFIQKQKKQNLLDYNNIFSWLQFLSQFSCQNLNFNHQVKRFDIIYGDSDYVISEKQILKFKKIYDNILFHKISDCGHAPLLHNDSLLKNIII